MKTVAVTDTLGSEHKFQKYITWLETGEAGLRHEVLSYKLNNLASFDRCHGLLLTGGHDVDPAFYGGPTGHPKVTDVDRRRDEFEGVLLDKALERGIPVLGICRGLQIANVHFGGTLLPDLEEAGYRAHKTPAGECRHDLKVDPASSFAVVTGRTEGTVNSNHHQAVAVVSDRFRIAALSDDGVVEAMELKEAAAHPFFYLVQYHPERMTDAENPFARNLLTVFLHSVTISHSHYQNRMTQ